MFAIITNTPKDRAKIERADGFIATQGTTGADRTEDSTVEIDGLAETVCKNALTFTAKVYERPSRCFTSKARIYRSFSTRAIFSNGSGCTTN